MKRFFYFLVAATLIISNITSAQAQDRSSKGTIIINGKELDIDKYAEIIENAAETIEDAVEQAAEAIEKMLAQKGIAKTDLKYKGEYDKLWDENKCSELPLR